MRSGRLSWLNIERGAQMDSKNPNLFFLGAAGLAITGFLLLDDYAPVAGFVWNVMNGNIKLGPAVFPYRLLLVVAVAVAAYGGYLRLK